MGWRPVQKVFKSWKILRGDKVKIMAGKDKGLTGTVASVRRDKNAVIVQGLNLLKKHVKRTADSPGGIITVESPIHLSNVALLDPVTGTPCRAAFRYLEDGAKVRVSRGNGASATVIPRPDILLQRKTPRPTEAGPRDTTPEVASAITYDMSPESGLPPLVFQNGRWELDTSQWASSLPVRIEANILAANERRSKGKKPKEGRLG